MLFRLILLLFVLTRAHPDQLNSDFSARFAGSETTRQNKLKKLFETFQSNKVSSLEKLNFLNLRNSEEQYENEHLVASSISIFKAKDGRKVELSIETPSLLQAKLQKENEVKSMDGKTSNVENCRKITSLDNQGSVLFYFSGLSAIELNFSAKKEDITNANFTKALVYIPSIIPHNFRYSASVFRYSVYEVDNPKTVSKKLKNCLQQSFPANIIPEFRGFKNVETCLRRNLGVTMASRSVTYAKGRIQSQKAESLDITRSMKKAWSQSRDAERSLILIISEHKDSAFSFTTPNNEGCASPPFIKLILMKNRTKCNPNEFKHEENEKNTATMIHNREAILRNNLRQKRSIESTVCQKHPMKVEFKDLGWSDWVIAPRWFQAYRCAGLCPYPLGDSLNSTNYALLLTMMNAVDTKNAPTPCCVPTSFTPVSILYLDSSNNVVLQKYENMVVETCGCR